MTAASATLEQAGREVRAGLERVSARLLLPDERLDASRGRLHRPIASYAAAQPAVDLADDRFWSAALAVQLAHRARHAEHAHRERLLHGARRAAAASGDGTFRALFLESVSDVLRLDAAGAGAAGSRVDWRTQALHADVELFGCALAAGAPHDPERAAALHRLGRRVGLARRMLRDVLDRCSPDVADRSASEPRGHGRALEQLEVELDLLLRELSRELGPGLVMQPIVEGWRLAARQRVALAEPSTPGRPARPHGARATDEEPPPAREWRRYMKRHGRSFGFASGFMRPSERARVAAVYAWCRYTDDLVDHAADPASAVERLDDWLERSRAAHAGERTGIELLDRVMRMTREAEVPFTYPAELIAGMRMDLRHRHYATLGELRLYGWRVAGAVGLWLAELHGVREPWALERAAMLGQAMQLTNIIRDVGEDLDRGRLYLPLDRLHAHGLSLAALQRARRAGGSPGDGWPALIEELIAVAERDYAGAAEALPALPAGFRRAVTVAAAVYSGIHGAVRRIDYATLHRRATTTLVEKLVLAARPPAWARAGRGSAPLRPHLVATHPA